MERTDTGLLLIEPNIKLHRRYFKEMVKLLGINVQYRAPKDDIVKYNNYGEMGSRVSEIEANYEPPVTIGCIYDEHPSQKNMRKLGWNAEMADSSVIIHVQYDLPKLQAGALFEIPAGIDHAEPRLFRVLRISNIAAYPASVACELGPVLIDTIPREVVDDFTQSNFNILADEEEDYNYD